MTRQLRYGGSPPGDETLLAGVAERDIGAFRVLCERPPLALRFARRCNDRASTVSVTNSGPDETGTDAIARAILNAYNAAGIGRTTGPDTR